MDRTLDYRRHARATPVEAILFRIASQRRPLLEGLARGWIVSRLEKEKTGKGVHALVRSSMERLVGKPEGERMWLYTRLHSMEVARFVYIMAREAQKHGVEGATGTDPKLVFAGGLVHDIGKTFMPLALMVKELGVKLGPFVFLKGVRLSENEKAVLRLEHLSTGTTHVRRFGEGRRIRTILDMVGLHHVMYNGRDTGVPSYPSVMRGMDLPLHARIAKTADLVSAAMPRHYRTNGYVATLDDSIAHAITVAGMEVDPVTVQCLITGHYDVDWETAGGVVSALSHPKGQEGIMNIHDTRVYAKEIVRADPDFKAVIARPSRRKKAEYDAEVGYCYRYYGIGQAMHEVN